MLFRSCLPDYALLYFANIIVFYVYILILMTDMTFIISFSR